MERLESLVSETIKGSIEKISGIDSGEAEKVCKAYMDKKYDLAKRLFTKAFGNNDSEKVSESADYMKHPDQVAMELIGAAIYSIKDGCLVSGIIIGTRSWPEIVYKDKTDQVKHYTQEPGKLYVYRGRRGVTFAITAHEGKTVNKPGKNQGVVSLVEVASDEEKILAQKLPAFFGIGDELDSRYVNTAESGIYVVKVPLVLRNKGFTVKEVSPKDADKWSREYRLG